MIWIISRRVTRNLASETMKEFNLKGNANLSLWAVCDWPLSPGRGEIPGATQIRYQECTERLECFSPRGYNEIVL